MAEHWCASLASPHTARAYREAVRGWLAWCDAVRRIDSLRAGFVDADRISPHSARHTAITLALANGAALHDVQDMAGHADPRTTRRYDRRRGHLDRSPTYRIAAALGGDA